MRVPVGKLLRILPKLHLKCKHIFYFGLAAIAGLSSLCYLHSVQPTADARLSGFRPGCFPDEQILNFSFRGDVHVHVNAPANLPPGRPVLLILYALPNGNTLDQTFGKQLGQGDDWHYDIQHTGAQLRFLRTVDLPFTPVLVLLQTREKSWPVWKAAHSTDHGQRIAALVDTLRSLFRGHQPRLMLTGHSGGGRFIFSYLDEIGEIPDDVTRFAFLDSNYGYEARYAAPLARWLARSKENTLLVFAYNDSLALLNGRRIVSDSGGTWHRSGRMLRDLSRFYTFTVRKDTAFQHWSAHEGRIQFFLKENPNRGIWHTQQVERNGLIHAVLAGSKYENHGYRYWGERAYESYIGSGTQLLPGLLIPPRSSMALTGSRFIAQIRTLTGSARERAIEAELSAGNIPAFLRTFVIMEKKWSDAAGDSHRLLFSVAPDYLAIGSEADFVRMPMTPLTAQRIAGLYGAILPTRKLVEAIWQEAAVKLDPQPIAPAGNRNELSPTFLQHQRMVEAQWLASGGCHGQLTAGHKKDVVLSNRMTEPERPGHVVIYGWHRRDGRPIQPLTNIHTGWYVDYSHGVRLLIDTMLIDGVPWRVEDILRDPVLYALISDEEGPMLQLRY